jgi:hypothetical protein
MSEVRSRRAPFRSVCLRWLLGILIFTLAGGVAWLLAARAALPWVSAYVLALAVAGVMHRLARVSEAGVVLWGLAVSAFSTGHWAATVGGEPGRIAELCLLSALILWVASCVAFLVAAAKDQTRRARNCAGFNLALFSLIAWFVVGNSINGPIRRQREVQQTTEELIELHKLAAEVESIRKWNGLLPKDDKEFAAKSSASMNPNGQVHGSGYVRYDENRYRLHGSLGHFWGRHHDLFGWIVYYYGPNSPRRLRVVPF